MLGGETGDVGNELLMLLLKTTGIMIFIYIGNRWLMPRLLHLIAMTHSQELFLMSMLLICLAVAMLTHELGMSLAFGAFLAGLMISDSEYSHSAFGNLIPFKDVFTSFFFVSIGMLLDLGFVYDHPWLVIATVLLVIFLKTIIAGFTAFSLGHTFFGTVVVGLSLAQVGEFSFILARLGLTNEIITPYSLPALPCCSHHLNGSLSTADTGLQTTGQPDTQAASSAFSGQRTLPSETG